MLLTLSMKHHQLLAYHLDSPNIFKAKCIVEKVRVVTVAELDITLRSLIERECPHLERVSLSKSVRLHGTHYAEGMIVSSGQCNDLPKFHKTVKSFRYMGGK